MWLLLCLPPPFGHTKTPSHTISFLIWCIWQYVGCKFKNPNCNYQKSFPRDKNRLNFTLMTPNTIVIWLPYKLQIKRNGATPKYNDQHHCYVQPVSTNYSKVTGLIFFFTSLCLKHVKINIGTLFSTSNHKSFGLCNLTQQCSDLHTKSPVSNELRVFLSRHMFLQIFTWLVNKVIHSTICVPLHKTFK